MTKSADYNIEKMQARLSNERYRLLSFVGQGGMADIYLAEDEDGLLYALKFLKEEHLHKKHYSDLFEIEAKTMRDFQHPNIVRFYEFTREVDCAYIRMAYIKGKSLDGYLNDLIKDGRYMPIEMVLNVCRQVVAALSRLHNGQQLHLDIKPANILMDDEKVYITDLGITLDSSNPNQTQRRFKAGTPYYMPYEQQNNEIVDNTADIYAFAIVLYRMLTHHLPFEIVGRQSLSVDEQRQFLKDSHQKATVPSTRKYRADLPPELDQIFNKALAKSPQNRYQSIRDFMTDIERVLEQNEITVIAPPTSSSQPSPKKQVKLMIIMAISGILLLMGALLIPRLFSTSPIDLDGIAVTVIMLNSTTVPQETATDEGDGWIDGIPPTLDTVQSPTLFLVETPSEEPSEIPPIETEDVVPSEVLPIITEIVVVETEIMLPSAVIPSSTPTSTLIPTEIPPTATLVPTSTVTPLPTSTPTVIPTAFLSGLSIMSFAENAQAVGIGDDLNLSIQQLNAEDVHLIPLRVTEINGFRVELVINDPEHWRSFGIGYQYQDENNYELLRIFDNQWEIISFQDGVSTERNSGRLDQPISRIVVNGRDEYLRYEIQDLRVQQVLSQPHSAGLAIFVDPNELGEITTLTISRLDDESVLRASGIPTLTSPQISFQSFLISDLLLLKETADMSGFVNCPRYLSIFDGLNRHAEQVPMVLTIMRSGQFIYNRCVTNSTHTQLSLGDVFSDFLSWYNSIDSFVADLEQVR